ncbi:10496_t:CDS:2 [Rhizophagus irregularis]|nr:10496_t:CDS:2 [Rhizophagus irregularis]
MPPDKKGKRKVAEGTNNPSYNQENLVKKFGISKPQISIDISNKEFKDQKWDRGAKYPEIESALYL